MSSPWVEIRRVETLVAIKGVVVELDFENGREGRLGEVPIVPVEGNRVSNELNCLLVDSILLE